MVKFWINYARTWVIIKRKQLGRRIFKISKHDYTKFAIVCQPRTGSNWLHTLLNSHPHIFSHGEILRRTLENSKSLNDLSVHSLVFGNYQEQIKAVGLKLFYEYSNNSGYAKSYQEILDDENILIIHLTRKNVLAQYISLIKAERTQIWSESSKLKGTTAIELDVDGYNIFNKDNSELKNKVREKFKHHQVLELSYEDLTMNLNKTLLKIQLFLHVRQKNLFSLLQKQSETSLKDQIINWKDFERLI